MCARGSSPYLPSMNLEMADLFDVPVLITEALDRCQDQMQLEHTQQTRHTVRCYLTPFCICHNHKKKELFFIFWSTRNKINHQGTRIEHNNILHLATSEHQNEFGESCPSCRLCRASESSEGEGGARSVVGRRRGTVCRSGLGVAQVRHEGGWV